MVTAWHSLLCFQSLLVSAPSPTYIVNYSSISFGLFLLYAEAMAFQSSHSGEEPTCDSVNGGGGYLHFKSASSLKYNAAGTMTLHPNQSHYTDTEPISSLR
jgi:hypothetical protein